jgi:hypothetical protein
MKYILGLEFFNQDKYFIAKKYPQQFLAKLSTMHINQLTKLLPQLKDKPWVAEITGLSLKFKFERKFIGGQLDYEKANSIGSRGVYLYFILEENKIYEIYKHLSWKKSERYFCKYSQNKEIKLTESEVVECLRQSLNSKFL